MTANTKYAANSTNSTVDRGRRRVEADDLPAIGGASSATSPGRHCPVAQEWGRIRDPGPDRLVPHRSDCPMSPGRDSWSASTGGGRASSAGASPRWKCSTDWRRPTSSGEAADQDWLNGSQLPSQWVLCRRNGDSGSLGHVRPSGAVDEGAVRSPGRFGSLMCCQQHIGAGERHLADDNARARTFHLERLLRREWFSAALHPGRHRQHRRRPQGLRDRLPNPADELTRPTGTSSHGDTPAPHTAGTRASVCRPCRSGGSPGTMLRSGSVRGRGGRGPRGRTGGCRCRRVRVRA